LTRNLADHDKDGRLTADEFVIAMHCCEIVRTCQTLPTSLPDDWLLDSTSRNERTNSVSKTNITPTFGSLNQQLKETFHLPATGDTGVSQSTDELSEQERKAALVTYEEKRLKNYEV
jgi:intersectin